ncbi:MAG: hypothetical protein ACC742_16105, partial [Thermoanaerobaculales bacterium]
MIPIQGGEVVHSPVRVEVSGSGRRLEARIQDVGEDLVVVVGGGQRPHVGCVVLAQPFPSRAQPGTWSATCSV